MNFENTRTCEMLAAAATRGKKEKLIAAASSALAAHQSAIALLVGETILSPQGAGLRDTFSLLAKILMTATCETESDVKTFCAIEDAVFADMADLRQKHGL